MSLRIKLGKLKDLKAYTDLLQRTYQHAYTNNSLGLSKNCFSKKIFNSFDTQKYLKSHLINNSHQKTWLGFTKLKMVGAVTCINKNKKEAELTGFYVMPEYQGQGIGSILYKKVLKFTQDKDLVLDIYTHNKKTISIYKYWGWKIDKSKGKNGYFYRHWPEWPKNLKAKCVYMKLKNKN
ncbi:GNAT family N-acetyltransferase [Patescibacteria group bacterium]